MQNSSIPLPLCPATIIECYLGINLGPHNYISVVHKNDKCLLVAKSIFESKKEIEMKAAQQNKLLLMVIEDLISDKTLKPFPLNLSSHNEKSCAPLKSLKISSSPNSEDIFIGHLHFIENQEKERKRFKVEVITEIFFERISLDISKIPEMERFHRNALANALELHRQRFFASLDSSPLELQFHFPQSNKNEYEIPKVESQEIETPKIVLRNQNSLDKKPSRRKISLPKSPSNLAFSASDSQSISPGRGMTTPSGSSPRSPLPSPKNISFDMQQTSFEFQHKVHPLCIELIKQLSSHGLEFCRLYCQSKLVKDKQNQELIKFFKKLINDNDIKIIRTSGFLKMFLMRFLIQENIERSLSNAILPDQISGDIERHLGYIFIAMKGKRLFHFTPYQKSNDLEGEKKEQAIAEDKCTNFSILLKMMIRLIDKSPDEAYIILRLWQNAVYQESLNGITNETFKAACETFLEDLRKNISFMNPTSSIYQFYSLMTAQTQITYTKTSMAVRYALPHAQLEECGRSLEYDFTTLPNIKLQVSLTFQSNSLQCPPFKLFILNGLTTNCTTNPGSWTCHVTLEVIPIVHHLENEKLVDTITSEEEAAGSLSISLEKQKQIHELIIKPLIDLGFVVFMQKDSLGRILKKI